MAKFDELTESLKKRFTGVPNITDEDVDGWIERAMLEHGYNLDQDVPQSQVLLVLLFAEWDGALQIALRAGHFFQYKDGEETVDKRAVSEQYRRIAAELKKSYDRKKAEGREGTSMFHVATRIDRN